MYKLNGKWQNHFTENEDSISYVCGYCDVKVSPSNKLSSEEPYPRIETGAILICTNCNRPTFVLRGNPNQVPMPKYGKKIDFLPTDISILYEEAKNCISVQASNAASMICRKILMNLAVEKGAKSNQSFQFYVDYLETNNYIPPDGRDWVDEIRKQGNEATHEISNIAKDDAIDILDFTSMLLTFIYEMPNRMNLRRNKNKNQ